MAGAGYVSVKLLESLAPNHVTAHSHTGTLTHAESTVWNTINSVGSVLFAYSFAMILLEIEDTLADTRGKDGKKSPTGPVSSMKWAVNMSVGTMTGFYCAIAWSIFASLGYNQTGFVLDDYQGVAPNWTLYLAYAMVIVHLVPAYQVWSQPHFAMAEEWIDRAVFKEKVPFKWVRLGYRVFYVCIITFLAVLLPFFNAILGFVGAMGFWPMTVFFPVWCWRKVYKPKRAFNVLLWTVDVFSFFVTLAVSFLLDDSTHARVALARLDSLFSSLYIYLPG